MFFVTLVIFTRSTAAYEALKSFNIVIYLHEPGASSNSISDQVAQYVLFKAECEKQGKCLPKSDGMLVFDEVKVACQLMWNSQNNTLSGLAAMTSKDLMSLTDVYQLLQATVSSRQRVEAPNSFSVEKDKVLLGVPPLWICINEKSVEPDNNRPA